MHRPNCCFLVLCLAACVIGLTGCGGGSQKEILDTEPVQGLVTLDGEPVPEAVVTFVPVTEGQGVSATGTTDANGVYTLTAAITGEKAGEAGAGTLPGEYLVGVAKTIVESPLSEEEAEEKGVEYVPSTGDPGADTTFTYVVPEKYNSPRDSEIKVTVAAGENDIPIELTSE